jgi:hypothetical protein
MNCTRSRARHRITNYRRLTYPTFLLCGILTRRLFAEKELAGLTAYFDASPPEKGTPMSKDVSLESRERAWRRDELCIAPAPEGRSGDSGIAGSTSITSRKSFNY